MSFKRLGDDFDAFKLQKKQRVNDLLLDVIPSDEVTLIKNGKLACLVCYHKPVFDTTTMLSIHRKGKKHIANALVKLERAKEDAEIKQKREHVNYLIKDEDCKNPLLGITQLKKEQALYESVAQHPPSRECTSSELDGNLLSPGLNKHFFGKRMHFNFKESSSIIDNTKPSCLTKKDLCLKTKTLKASKDKNGKREEFLSVNPLTKQKSNFNERETPVCDTNMEEIMKLNQNNTATLNTDDTTSIHKTPTSVTFYSHNQLSNLYSLDTRSKALYLSKLRQIGWILGTDGKWEKDKDAEFESDEDEPPSPSTVLSG